MANGLSDLIQFSREFIGRHDIDRHLDETAACAEINRHFKGARRTPTPGRSSELHSLLDEWQTAIGGHLNHIIAGRVVLLAGTYGPEVESEWRRRCFSSWCQVAEVTNKLETLSLQLQPADQDDSAFRPASEFLREPIGTIRAINKVLRDNTWIRSRKPSKQRLLVHAGDWSKYLANISRDPLDNPAAMVDDAIAAHARMLEIQETKKRK